MTMDIQKSLLTYIYNLLTTDPDLKTAMGGTVHLYLTWAKPNAPFPYLVNRIDMGIEADWSPVARCTYYLDIWSHSGDANDEIFPIRKRIIELLDGLIFSTAETTDCHLWIQTDAFIPESESGIWHYACMFNLKWLKDAQIGALLKR